MKQTLGLLHDYELGPEEAALLPPVSGGSMLL